MNFLNKIQNLPVKQRKIILWSVMIILGFFLFWFNLRNFQIRMKTIEREETKEKFQIPKLEEELKEVLKNFPKFKMPAIK